MRPRSRFNLAAARALGSLCVAGSLIALSSCDSDDPKPSSAPTANEHGVDPAMWTELSWISPTALDIGRFAAPMPIVQWLRGLKLDEDGHCKAALEAITHYYMVTMPGLNPESSIVFLGSPDIEEANKCADKFSTRLGFTVERIEQRLVLTQAAPDGVEIEGGAGRFAAQWVEKNGTMMVIADDPERIDSMLAAPGTLEDPEGERLRALLGDVQTGEDAAPWIVGQQDVSKFWLDTPGLGYVGTLLQTREKMVAMGDLVFATRADAEHAEANVATLYGDAKLLEPDFAGYAELPPAPSTRLRFRAEVPLQLATLSRLEAAMTKLRALKAQAEAAGRTLTAADLAPPSEAAGDTASGTDASSSPPPATGPEHPAAGHPKNPAPGAPEAPEEAEEAAGPPPG